MVEVLRKKGERRQPWFSRELAILRKVFHDSEKEWLSCDSKGTRREKRREYVDKRRRYKKAVSRAGLYLGTSFEGEDGKGGVYPR